MATTTRGTATRIREWLEDEIARGILHPGEKLDLQGVAERFRCSRTPVREAVQALEVDGFVRVVPKQGTFVTHLSLVDLVERFAVMSELEGMATRLAAQNAGAPDLDAIEEALHACEAAVATHDTEAYFDANTEFHAGIYRASGNRHLEAEVLRYQRSLRAYRKAQLSVPSRLERSLVEHREILAALRERDSTKAGLLAGAHVAVQVEEYRHLARV